MVHRLACKQGHQWEVSGESQAPHDCPQCGGPGETIAEGKSLSTNGGPIDEFPPPPSSGSSKRQPKSSEGDANLDASPTPGPRKGPGSFSLPESFGRYRILKRLGYGGMGAVYLAQDNQLDRNVALKVPHFVDDKHPRLLERFQREAQAAAALDHPHICSVYDVGQIDGVNYIAMAYIDGEPLSKLISIHEQLPERGVADLVRRLALALAEAHAKGVVHRDLKPANIMINKRHEPVIMDFGLARREQSGDARLTGKGAVLGTPAYMAPEQVGGNPQQVGPACDIYSLGVIMYELLTGQLPFDGSVGEILAAVAVLPPTPLSQFRPDIDPQLESICLQALAKKPEQRVPSMNDFALALGDFLEVDASMTPKPLHTPDDSVEPKQRPSEIQREPTSDSQAEQLSDKDGLATQLLTELAARIESGAITSVPNVKSSQVDRGRWWRPLAVAATILILAVLTIVFLINRPSPVRQVTIRFEISTVVLNDPTVVVLLDDRELTREQLNDPVSVTTGQHRLVVKRGDEILESRTIDVESQGSQTTIPLLVDKQNQKSVGQSRFRKAGDLPQGVDVDSALTIKIDKEYSWDNPLTSSLTINDQKVGEFESTSQQNVADRFLPGWNLVTLKTRSVESTDGNQLLFSLGPFSSDEGGDKFSPLLWTFRNGDGWSRKDDKYTHKFGADVDSVPLSFHLYYAGLERENHTPVEGDFVLNGVPEYGWQTPITATVFVNGIPLNSFAGCKRQVVITDLLKRGKNEIRLVCKRVDNSAANNDIWISIARLSKLNRQTGTHDLKPIARFSAMTNWTRHEQAGGLVNPAEPESNTVDRTIPLFLTDDPKGSPVSGGERQMMVVTKGKYPHEQHLVSELTLNDQIIGIFTADTFESIDSALKPGWNTIDLRTYANFSGTSSNSLNFQFASRHRDPTGKLVDQILWQFQNDEAWSVRNKKPFNLLGPDETEVTVSMRLYYANQNFESRDVTEGDFVLLGKTEYESNTTSVTSTVFVNGQPLNSFVGQSRQIVITPLLVQGKNEIRLVTSPVKNCLDENDILFTVQGPAKYNRTKQNYDLGGMLLEFNSLKGWKRNETTGQLINTQDANQNTLERTLEFTISELPGEKTP